MIAKNYNATSLDSKRVTVLYARYSTDMQNEQSCEDQIRQIRQYLDREGIDHTNAEVITDEGLSGTREDRPGFQKLLKLIRQGQVALLVVDELSRLTRGNNATNVIEDIKFHQGRFIACGESIDSTNVGWEMATAFKQMSNKASVAETARRVRRGKEGRVRAGLSAGDLPFGYKSYYVDGDPMEQYARGQKPRKGIEIDESQAEVVREAFALFVGGKSLAGIAREFTLRKIPRGNRVKDTNWSHQQVRRLLVNSKYIGIWQYGMTTTIRDSAGNKRQVKTDPSEHVIMNRPEARIIDDSTWNAACERFRSLEGKFGFKPNQDKRGPRSHPSEVYPNDMLSGLITCSCGAKMHQAGHKKYPYYICPIAKRNDGRCDMHAYVPAQLAKTQIIGIVLDELRNESGFNEEIFHEVKAHLERVVAQTPSDQARIDAAITEAQRARNKLIKVLEYEGANDIEAILERIKTLSSQIHELELEQTNAAARQSVIDRFPSLEWIQAQLLDSAKLLESESPKSTLLLRKLIKTITAEPVLAVAKKRGFMRLRFDFNGYAAFVNALEQSDCGQLTASMLESETLDEPTSKSFTIDLGKPTKVDEWGPKIVQMRDSGMKWAEIEKISGLKMCNLNNYYSRYKKSLAGIPNDAPVRRAETGSNSADDLLNTA